MSRGGGPVAARREAPAPKAERPSADRRRSAASGVLRGALAVLFSAVLVLPRLRLARRKRSWNWLRAALLLAAVAAAYGGAGWGWLVGGCLALLAIAFPRTRDPDRERRLQRMHGAEYLLNGGEWAGDRIGEGRDALGKGEELYLLLRGEHLLLVPRKGTGEVQTAVRVLAISRILVDGREYAPVYVSEAKQPPVREQEVDRHAVAELALEVDSGNALRFAYRGAFCRHLAETAAHAIHSVRGLSGGPLERKARIHE